MARISLIICDLCKNEMTKEESGEEYSVTLSSLNGGNKNGEACEKCFTALLNRLLSTQKPKVIVKSTPPSQPVAVSKPETISEKPVAPVAQASSSTEELLEDEIKHVPSNFNPRKAAKAVREMNNGETCLHHFKSFKDNRFICIDAPGGLEGELSGFKGCGKPVSASEYTVSRPRHFAFK